MKKFRYQVFKLSRTFFECEADSKESASMKFFNLLFGYEFPKTLEIEMHFSSGKSLHTINEVTEWHYPDFPKLALIYDGTEEI